MTPTATSTRTGVGSPRYGPAATGRAATATATGSCTAAATTLNVAGKRIGPAEIESVLAMHPAVAESAVVGLPDELKGETIACVVVLRAGEAGSALATELRGAVRERLGGAFTPHTVVFAEGLPKTRSAKIVRQAVRAALTGDDAGDLSSPEDPQVLDAIRAAREP